MSWQLQWQQTTQPLKVSQPVAGSCWAALCSCTWSWVQCHLVFLSAAWVPCWDVTWALCKMWWACWWEVRPVYVSLENKALAERASHVQWCLHAETGGQWSYSKNLDTPLTPLHCCWCWGVWALDVTSGSWWSFFFILFTLSTRLVSMHQLSLHVWVSPLCYHGTWLSGSPCVCSVNSSVSTAQCEGFRVFSTLVCPRSFSQKV